MDNHYIPNSFLPLTNYEDIEFRNGNIYFKIGLLDSQDTNLLQFFCFVLFISPILPFILPNLLKFYFDFRIQWAENLVNSIFEIEGLLHILSLIWILSIILFWRKTIRLYRVIDTSNNSINLEFYFFNKLYFKKKIDINCIVQIGNNVSYLKNNDFGKSHHKTGYFHIYKVSILLNNGKLLDILSLGSNENDYLISRTVASAIANLFNIPLILCEEDSYLKVNEKIIKGILVNKTEKYLTTEKIPILNLVKNLGYALLISIGIVFFFIIMFSLIYFYSDYKVKVRIRAKKSRKTAIINNSDIKKNAIKIQYK